ncbi:MAG: tRNA (adenosine(37)-N6)-threonylcarbamoyltransferase complex dimerization subunit type 1 TsaB [Pseudomonadota bacterium]
MLGTLAIETATDACSVAVWLDGHVRERHQCLPRQHSHLLFAQLRELVAPGPLTDSGIGLVAYGSGPGSFTGLRIAASAVQGLAYASGLPAVPVPTLATMAMTALNERVVSADQTVLVTLDARLQEVYAAVYQFRNGAPVLCEGPWACAPGQLTISTKDPLVSIGSGGRCIDEFPAALRSIITGNCTDLLPRARDMVRLANLAAQGGYSQSAFEVQPVYVRDEIGWKKVGEQGKTA